MDPAGAFLTVALAVALSTLAAILVSRRTGRRAAVELLDGVLREYRIRLSKARLSEKPRRRYVVFEVIGGPRLGRVEVERAVLESLRSAFGASILAESGARLVAFDEERRRGIIRVNHRYKSHLIAALGLVREINNSRVVIVPLSTTGSIKRARRVESG